MLKIKKLLASIAAIAMMNSYIPFLSYMHNNLVTVFIINGSILLVEYEL